MLHVYVIYAILHVIEGICGSANSEVSVDDKLASFHGRLKLLMTGVFDKQFKVKTSDYIIILTDVSITPCHLILKVA